MQVNILLFLWLVYVLLLFFSCNCIFFFLKQVFSSQFTTNSWSCFICISVPCFLKKPSLLLFFVLMKCAHEFAEHCIKFIKNYLILKMQKWMQKKCYLYFFLLKKKRVSETYIVHTCNVFFSIIVVSLVQFIVCFLN